LWGERDNLIVKKGQGAVEFLIIFGATLFFFVLFMTAVKISAEDKAAEKYVDLADGIALLVRDEILLAHKSSEGYEREFIVPINLYGKAYDINVTPDGTVYVYTEDIGISYQVANVSGTINKGANTIRKSGGAVYLNK